MIQVINWNNPIFFLRKSGKACLQNEILLTLINFYLVKMLRWNFTFNLRTEKNYFTYKLEIKYYMQFQN